MTHAQARDEEHERGHLAETLRLLELELARLVGSIDSSAVAIDEQKKHMWADWRDMDSAEKADFRNTVNLSVALGDHAVMTRKRVERLLQTPYFGRVDFRRGDEAGTGAHYIGVHNFSHPETQEIVIHDWRAPVSSL